LAKVVLLAWASAVNRRLAAGDSQVVGKVAAAGQVMGKMPLEVVPAVEVRLAATVLEPAVLAARVNNL
jgi:hypothetical protein